MRSQLETFVETERAAVEQALADQIADLEAQLGAVAEYTVAAGGKRIRPLLFLAAYRESGGKDLEAGAIHTAATALELIHTYSLIHDDLPIMDDDLLRRGLPTAHRVYGVDVATTGGAAIQQVAFLALARAAIRSPRLASVLPDLVRRLGAAAGSEGMVGGQYLDLQAEGRDVDAPTLEAIHRGKTAALISAACAMGGVAAAADSDVVDSLSAYGVNLGLAFQIVDDVLDVIGDPDTMGKAAGVDEARQKATYPEIHGVEGARAQAEEAGRLALDSLAALPNPTPILEGFVAFVLERLH